MLNEPQYFDLLQELDERSGRVIIFIIVKRKKRRLKNIAGR
jgi:hypothetical protein